ncbi:type II toxin-antitoxin system death-on-curing family toxin [Actinocorallia aurea]
MIYLTSEELTAINARHLGSGAVRDAGLVASAAARPATVVFGEDAYPSVEEKAAALLHSLICNHPFLDGNRRTAWAACRVFLLVNGHDGTLSDDAVFDLVLRVASCCSEIEAKVLARDLQVVASTAPV